MGHLLESVRQAKLASRRLYTVVRLQKWRQKTKAKGWLPFFGEICKASCVCYLQTASADRRKGENEGPERQEPGASQSVHILAIEM
jgi:hypothetical protein